MSLENPTLDFLTYLIEQCIKQCGLDPEKTTVKEFMEIIAREEAPIGF
jgi:hypothetical protein